MTESAETVESWETTLTLLTRAREGDSIALDDLFRRYFPALSRWARGRLPVWARDMADTQDLVQDALIQTFKQIDWSDRKCGPTFEHRGAGALHAYLRQAVMNRIRDEIRRVNRRPPRIGLDDVNAAAMTDAGLSPLEQAVGTQEVERYEAALLRLSEDDRELIVARLEMGLTFGEVASATGRNSADAARMAVSRALMRLAEEMT